MKKQLGLPLKWKLILFTSLLLLLPCLTIGVFSFINAKAEVGQQMMQTADQNVRSLSKYIDQMISPKVNDVGYLSATLSESSFEKNEQFLHREEFNKYNILHPEALLLIAANEETAILSPDRNLPSGYEVKKSPWYEQAMNAAGKTIITAPYLDPITGVQVIAIARTVSDDSAVFAIELDINAFAKVADEQKIGSSGYVAILDQHQKLVIHPTEKFGTPVAGDWVNQLYKQDTGTFSYMDQGQKMWMSFVTNKLTGLKLAGTIYDQELAHSADSILITTSIVVALALLVGFGANYAVIASIVKPIHTLVTASKKIKQGDLTVHIAVSSKDEIGQLAEHFNAMSESLRGILQKVREQAMILASSSDELAESTETTSKATQMITESIQGVAFRAEKQVGEIQNCVATMEQMSAGIEQIAANAKTVSSTAAQAAEKADEGNEAIQITTTQMNRMNDTMLHLANVVQGLQHRSVEIGQFVDFIKQISSQTNLLALNAAIEAARAGEHGKGFAVVADEVRKLAEQSAGSAGQIAELIAAIQAETQSAVKSMSAGTKEVAVGLEVAQRSGELFKQIQDYVITIAEQIHEVSTSSAQISSGTADVAASISAIAAAAEQNAAGNQQVSSSADEQSASLQEISAASASLTTMAQDLQKLVTSFTL
ncbi:methyl-accepting chemotaxis protein [Brevibacillus fluminis]|uniref:methyl-accepting chemotaxis protein n=1 Tax=Brevibacillus fluminis TaxID=511487 RepID=UPI003F899ECE